MSIKNSFLQKYTQGEEVEKIKGIPGVTMNAPRVNNTLKSIGLELEVEGRRLPSAGHLERIVSDKTKAVWVVHDDGSLRNGGREYVLSQPVGVEEVEGMLRGLYDSFRTCGSSLSLSNRCSTHVHINMNGYRVNTLTSIIALWTAFEEPLVNWCGEERVTNHFCLSGKDTTALISIWRDFLTSGRLSVPEGAKYSALNLRRLHDFGSFEFRTMRADEDYEPILDWTKFLYNMVLFANNNYSNPVNLAGDLSERGALQIFSEISRLCSPSFRGSVLAHPHNQDFDRMVIDGFRRAQPLVLGFPWDDWMTLVNEEYVPSPFKVFKTRKTSRDLRVEPVEWAEVARLQREMEMRPIGREFAEALDRVGREALDRVGRGVIPAPINPNNAVDPDLPIEFGDGTPAVILARGREAGLNDSLIQVRPVRSFRVDRWNELVSQAGGFWYELPTGQYNGDPDGRTYPWIRNTIVDVFEPVGQQDEPEGNF